MGDPLSFFETHCSIVYKQWKTIGKQWEQYKFELFLSESKNTIILCLLTKFGVIIITFDRFMTDFRFLEMYIKYIGFTQFCQKY